MPTFKKYSGIKACEDAIQRIDLSSNSYQLCRPFYTVAGYTKRYIYMGTNTTTNKNLHYLSVVTVKASADDYDAEDYNGTYTGSCTFTLNKSIAGITYVINFVASEDATIKCFKFFKNLQCGDDSSGGNEQTVLMFAVYFDEPITVKAGDIRNMSLSFVYDDIQVSII